MSVTTWLVGLVGGVCDLVDTLRSPHGTTAAHSIGGTALVLFCAASMGEAAAWHVVLGWPGSTPSCLKNILAMCDKLFPVTKAAGQRYQLIPFTPPPPGPPPKASKIGAHHGFAMINLSADGAHESMVGGVDR